MDLCKLFTSIDAIVFSLSLPSGARIDVNTLIIEPLILRAERTGHPERERKRMTQEC